MSDIPGRPCPTCGTRVPDGQRFCSNCGTDMSGAQPVSQYGGPPPQSFSAPSQVPSYARQSQPVPPYAQQPQQSSPIAEALGALGLLFLLRRYRPGYVARRQSSGCCGCLVLLVILLIVLGIPGYAAYKNYSSQIQQQTGHSGNAVGATPTGQPAITTVTINQTVIYASVNITLVSAQQSSAFLDDTSGGSNGMVRVNIKETNNSSGNPNYLYSDIAKLLLPDQSSVALTSAQQAISPASNVARANWLDFAVSSSDKIGQLTLVLGTSQTAQIRIPLTGKANLSAFQAKTINPNKPISYAGLNWTLKTATSALSAGGQQASTGMRYIVLTFTVDNPTSGSVVIGFASEYMRLKAGSTTNPALSTTLPLQIDAQTNGISGTVTFLMPESEHAFTLVLLGGLVGSDPHSPTSVNTDFSFS